MIDVVATTPLYPPLYRFISIYIWSAALHRISGG